MKTLSETISELVMIMCKKERFKICVIINIEIIYILLILFDKMSLTL